MGVATQNQVLVPALITGISLLTYFYRKDIAKIFGWSSEQESKIRLLRFEVYGQVEGSDLLTATKDYALKIGALGYMWDTERGSIRGNAQGPQEIVQQMHDWLRDTCLANPKFERIVFSKIVSIPEYYAGGFDVITAQHYVDNF